MAVVTVDSFVGAVAAAAGADEDGTAAVLGVGLASSARLGIPVAVPLMAGALLCTTGIAPLYKGGCIQGQCPGQPRDKKLMRLHGIDIIPRLRQASPGILFIYFCSRTPGTSRRRRNLLTPGMV